MTPIHSPLSRSQPTSTRRAGNRSAIDESRIPPSAYGRNEHTSTRAESNGDPVRSNTRIDNATWAATVPSIDTVWARKMAGMPGTRRTPR